MKTASQLKQEQERELEEGIAERLQKIKKRKGYYYFLSDITFPENEKQKFKYLVIKKTTLLEEKMPTIKKIIKSIKRFVPQVWKQDAITAVYLLLGKVYCNLDTMLILAKEGRNFEIIDIARSGQESIDLAFLLLEEGQEERLKKWFKGEIIGNKVARKKFHKVLNLELNPHNLISKLPIYEGKTEIYGVYSLYTHSSYAALLDTIDVFHEDFDYSGISGFHYTLKNFDNIIRQLMVSLLLELKNVFTKYKDLENVNEIDKLLEQMGDYKASEEEIKETLKRYSKE